MKKLKKGDRCRVRILKTGEIADAIYDEVDDENNKEHWVYVKGVLHIAASGSFGSNYRTCRFIGPAGVRS